jgi:hypothetical protein
MILKWRGDVIGGIADYSSFQPEPDITGGLVLEVGSTPFP